MTSDPAILRPGLVAVVVTYNRFQDIQITLERLRVEGVDAIVLVDNGSTDGTRDWLATLDDPALHIVLTEANIGGAGGFNVGMRYARKRLDPDWVLLTDDDGRPAPGALDRFRALDHAGFDGIAGAALYPDGEICDMNRPLRNPFALSRRRKGGFRIADADYAADAAPREIDMATFVGLFLSRRALAAVDGPDPRLFIYGDDLLHTLLIAQSGLHLRFDPRIRFEHDCATLSGENQIYDPVWKVYYHYRNAILLYRQAAGWMFWPVMALRLPRWYRKARKYGENAHAFRALLRKAVRDGVRGQLDDPPKGIPGPPPNALEIARRLP